MKSDRFSGKSECRSIRVRRSFLLVALLLSLVCSAASQDLPTQEPGQSRTSTKIRVAVDQVYVEAVVMDKSGQHVTDLKPEDFQVFFDGRAQKLTNFSYTWAQPSQQPEIQAIQEERARTPIVPSHSDPEPVSRTVALVLDDLGLSVRGVGSARESVKRFLGEQMQHGDLVGIMRTGSQIGTMEQFSSDREVLQLAAERLSMNPLRRGKPSGPDFFDRLNRYNKAREEYFTLRTLDSLQFIIRGMRDLPGRKSVILFSEGFQVFNFNPDRVGENSRGKLLEYVQRVISNAHRTGVVIYSIDPLGLQVSGLTASDDLERIIYGGRQSRVGLKVRARPLTGRAKHLPDNDVQSNTTRQRMYETSAQRSSASTLRDGEHAEIIAKAFQDRNTQSLELHASLHHLAKETGGLFFANTNDINGSLDRALEDQKGYYLIGFIPEDATSRSKKTKPRFQRIKVKVRPSNLKVRARTSAFGNSDPGTPERTPQEQLFSPFVTPWGGQIGLSLKSAYKVEPGEGAFIDSVFHIDAGDLSFSGRVDGTKEAHLEVFAGAFGDDHTVQTVNQTLVIEMGEDTYRRTLREGLAFPIRVTVDGPGVYQVRVIVRDRSSPLAGSASRFVVIPDTDGLSASK